MAENSTDGSYGPDCSALAGFPFVVPAFQPWCQYFRIFNTAFPHRPDAAEMHADSPGHHGDLHDRHHGEKKEQRPAAAQAPFLYRLRCRCPFPAIFGRRKTCCITAARRPCCWRPSGSFSPSRGPITNMLPGPFPSFRRNTHEKADLPAGGPCVAARPVLLAGGVGSHHPGRRRSADRESEQLWRNREAPICEYRVPVF